MPRKAKGKINKLSYLQQLLAEGKITKGEFFHLKRMRHKARNQGK
jgi:hypothetical protein